MRLPASTSVILYGPLPKGMLSDVFVTSIFLWNSFDIKFAFNKYVVGEEFCIKNLKLNLDNLNDISFNMLNHATSTSGLKQSK